MRASSFFFFLFILLVKNVSMMINQTLNISLHQCQQNLTLFRKILFSTEQSFQSCNLNCCTKTNFNQTTCQITSETYTGVCLGRLCYSGECEHYLSSILPKNFIEIQWPKWIDRSYIPIRYSILIFLLLINGFLTLLTLIFVIRSIRHAQAIAARKLRRYSLF